MPDIDIAPVSSESSVAPVVSESSVPDLPPSGGLSSGGNQLPVKLSEQEIIDSFNKPNKEDVKPVEVKSEIQEPPVQELTDEEKAAELAKQEEEAVQAEEMTPEEDISDSKINQFVREIPELKQAFDKNPAVRNSFYAMARRSSKLSEYQAIIPSPEAAKFAAANSEALVNMNDLFFSEVPEENGQFWQTLYDNSMLKDPVSGEPVLGQDGRPISTGAYERVTSAYRQALYSDLDALAGRITDPEVAQKAKEAIQMIGELTGDLRRQNQQQPKDLPEDVKQRLANAERIENQFKEQQSSQAREFGKTTTGEIVSTIKTDVAGHVERMVKTQNIALTQYEQKKVTDDIFQELDRLASENKQYQLHFDSLSKRAPLTEAGRKSLVTEARKFAKDNLPSVALKIIREATSSTVQKTQEADAKRVAQASKKEVKTNGGAPNPGNSHQSIKDKAAAMRAQLKRPLTQEEILAL